LRGRDAAAVRHCNSGKRWLDSIKFVEEVGRPICTRRSRTCGGDETHAAGIGAPSRRSHSGKRQSQHLLIDVPPAAAARGIKPEREPECLGE
jgi:hypothetical protein